MPKAVCCISCNGTQSLLWRPCEDGQICHECYLIDRTNAVSPSDEKEKDKDKEGAEKSRENGDAKPKIADLVEVVVKVERLDEDKREERKEGEEAKPKEGDEAKAAAAAVEKEKTRSGKKTGNRWTRPRAGAKDKGATPARGRGRRSIFKRPPFKAPSGTATVVTADAIYYNGTYMQVGDIVSLIGTDDCTYYAQIRGFMTDEYCEKSAVLTWLLPTKASPPPQKQFDPATYIIGPDEDIPRKLECMEFIMHAPSDYYKTPTNPYPPIVIEPASHGINNFVWTTIEAKDR